MAVVKSKPTSPGRRFQVRVVNPDLHKGEPVKALVEKKSKSGGRNNGGRLLRATRVVVISSVIALLTLSVTRMAFPLLLNV